MIYRQLFPLLRHFLPVALLLPIIVSEAFAAAGGIPGAPPPNASQCKNGWTLVAGATSMDFGTFAVESGTGSLLMDNAGQVTAPANISLLASAPTSSFTATLTNTNTQCGSTNFTINATVPDLTGPATIPLNTLLTATDSLGTALVSNATLPQILSTTNLPVSLIFHGNLTANPATGTYSSTITVDFTDAVGTLLSTGGAVTATSVLPINLLETVQMNFGTVAGGTLPGTVILDTLGARTITGDAQVLAVGPGQAGEFQITGEPGLSYILTIAGPAILENSFGDQMTATAFTNNSLGTLPLVTGVELFQVGATLNLNPLQPGGTYSTAIGAGQFYTVTVNYN